MGQQQKLKEACAALILKDNVKYSELESKHYKQLANTVGLSVAEVRRMLRDMEQQWKAYRELLAAKDSAVILENDYLISQANSKFWKNATKAKKSFLGFRRKPLSTLDYAFYTIIFRNCELQNLHEDIGNSEENSMRSDARSYGSLGKRKSDSASPSSSKRHEHHCAGFRLFGEGTSYKSETDEVIEHLKRLGISPGITPKDILTLIRTEVQKVFLSLKEDSSKLQFLKLFGIE